MLATGPGWTWAALAALGAFHGLNPAMGWLFAVALGLQEGRRGGVLRALPPIALGHALSVALVIAVIAGAEATIAPGVLRFGGASVLIGFGLYRIWRRARHPRRVGMQVSGGELVLWSFLMASAHGAGLMLVPVLLGSRTRLSSHLGWSPAFAHGLTALGVHTAVMFGVMAVTGLVVYETVGVRLLRRMWINFDLIWAVALIGAGVATILLAVDHPGMAQ